MMHLGFEHIGYDLPEPADKQLNYYVQEAYISNEIQDAYSQLTNACYIAWHLINCRKVAKIHGSTESLTYLYGSPQLELSMEGLGAAIAKAWNTVWTWITGMFRHIGQFFGICKKTAAETKKSIDTKATEIDKALDDLEKSRNEFLDSLGKRHEEFKKAMEAGRRALQEDPTSVAKNCNSSTIGNIANEFKTKTANVNQDALRSMDDAEAATISQDVESITGKLKAVIDEDQGTEFIDKTFTAEAKKCSTLLEGMIDASETRFEAINKLLNTAKSKFDKSENDDQAKAIVNALNQLGKIGVFYHKYTEAVRYTMNYIDRKLRGYASLIKSTKIQPTPKED